MVEGWARYNFYSIFVEGIHDGLNDPEDDEVSIQPGAVNVMTVHQSKGLQFEVVIVLRPDRHPFLGDTHILEDELGPFAARLTQPSGRRSRQARANEDAVRLFFVAHSRAKRLLVLAGYNFDDWDLALGRTSHGNPLTRIAALQQVGVHVL